MFITDVECGDRGSDNLVPKVRIEMMIELARRIHGCRSLTVDFTRAWAGVRRFSAPGVEVVSVGVRG